MKKSLLFLGMLALGLANAQQTTPSTTSTTPTTNGKVGINTETPTRTLDINGDLRVRTLDNASDFNGFLTSETIGAGTDAETNVVRKANTKARVLARLLRFPNSMNLTRTGASNSSTVIRDNDDTVFTDLPELPVEAQEYLELSPDKKFYYVKKSGFYRVKVSYFVDIQNSNLDTFDGSFGRTYIGWSGRTHKDDPKTAFQLGGNTVNIFKGANTPRQSDKDGTTFSDNYRANSYRINASGAAFIPKGGRIALQIIPVGMASTVNDDNGLNRIIFNPYDTIKNRYYSYIDITVNL